MCASPSRSRDLVAVSVLGIEALTSFVAAVYAYLPNVLAALLIFLVASAVAAGSRRS